MQLSVFEFQNVVIVSGNQQQISPVDSPATLEKYFTQAW